MATATQTLRPKVREAKKPEIGDLYEPVGELVLIRRSKEKEAITEGGVVIPDAHQQRNNTGIVLAVRQNSKGVEVGDEVVLRENSGDDMKLDGQEVALFFFDDIVLRKKVAS
jgi:co-chaperonin GroES (HSP10)